jgi:hypothetical protein
VLENVIMPMDFCNAYAPNERRDKAMALLERLVVENASRSAREIKTLPATLSIQPISEKGVSHEV